MHLGGGVWLRGASLEERVCVLEGGLFALEARPGRGVFGLEVHPGREVFGLEVRLRGGGVFGFRGVPWRVLERNIWRVKLEGVCVLEGGVPVEARCGGVCLA